MTLGAAALNLAEPKVAASGGPRDALAVQASLADAVSYVTVDDYRAWDAIVIHYAEPPRPASARLAAVQRAAPKDTFHFIVHVDGRVTATQRWQQQEPLGPEAEGVHICFLPGSGSELPRVQWEAFRELVGMLQSRWQVQSARVTLAEASDITRRPDLPRQAALLRDMLSSTGLIR